MTFYGVYFPPGEYEDTQSYVSKNKSKVLDDAKKYKKARFKPFPTFSDAMTFAQEGPKQIISHVNNVGSIEKSSPHRAPKVQELSYFRKAIETNNYDTVQRCVSHNPRYLVSSGDTPSILQEGFRYNALHIAAKSNSANIISYILKCLSSVDFMKFLYGEDEDPELLESRSNVLVDMYLNTPDKGMNETPLHFASKFGSLEALRVLVSYSQCDKSCVNKNNETSLDIVCSRKGDLETKHEISRLLECEYFIAVLRSPDRSVEPILAEPFPISSPPTSNRGVMSADMEVSAIAGPMKEEDALIFRRKWKKPMSSPITSPKSNDIKSPTNDSPLKYSFMDPEKRIESIGRELSLAFGVPWSEYWPFMQTFANLRTENGLDVLEKYLEKRYTTDLDSSPDSSDNTSSINSTIVSPISQLCSIFDKLSLDKNKSPSTPEASGKALSYLCIDRTTKIYAKKLAQVIPSANMMSVLSEITRMHLLISSCAQDGRYRKIEFNRIHSRLSLIVKGLLLSNKERGDKYITFFEELLKSNYLNDLKTKEQLYNATYCLCNKLISALKNDSFTPGNDSGDNSSDEELAYMLWTSSEVCNCNLEFKGKSYRQSMFHVKKLDLGSDSSDEDECSSRNNVDKLFLDSNENKLVCTDSADEEDEFFTPPSSPALSSSSSMDDVYSADEGSPIFILGSYPTKVDAAVYDAIDDKLVTPRKYPYTFQWLHCYKKQSKQMTSVFSPLSPDVQKRLNRWE